MNNVSVAITTIAILVGLLVTAATVVAFYRSSYARATIETLRDSNEALTERVKELEAENQRQGQKLAHLEQEAADLRTYVSGTEAVRTLDLKIDQTVMPKLDAIYRAIAKGG